ncbi:29955_t:CDS:2, partial [Gigaspora margarita]
MNMFRRFIICSLSSFQNKLPNEINSTESEINSNKSIPSSKFWIDSETKALLSFLGDNFDLYRKNKQKFYAAAAINIDNNRTSAQIDSKIQSFRTRYEKEIKEETGKARSKWPYLDKMNELFGNRENVKPDYLISSINENMIAESDENHTTTISKKKKQKVSEVDQIYLDELNSLKKAKKESLNIAQERLEIECEKLKWKKEKFDKEQEWKFKLEMERMEKEFDHKLKVRELELKYQEKYHLLIKFWNPEIELDLGSNFGYTTQNLGSANQEPDILENFI